ncbi:PilZ domain-containing protein [Sphingobium aquiterrae]|uniref:PilZ domain-containing protein n=1 Tax=Sphingobium aquiterrae TaxID=2038656 RepID=UPI0030176462
MTIQRRRERTTVDIAITVTTVLDSLPATITDLNEFGAKIEGAALAEGTRFQIDVDGHDVFGIVRWAEVDRMGVFFPFGIEGSPLAQALEMAQVVPAQTAMRASAMPMRPASAAALAPAPRGFGRRSN